MNLALQKSTSQSTDFGGYPSSNAVDVLNKHCMIDGFAHTLDREYEWWQVDLGEICEIRKIQIYYRTNRNYSFYKYLTWSITIEFGT